MSLFAVKCQFIKVTPAEFYKQHLCPYGYAEKMWNQQLKKNVIVRENW